jgi:hypothetical protein
MIQHLGRPSPQPLDPFFQEANHGCRTHPGRSKVDRFFVVQSGQGIQEKTEVRLPGCWL